MANSSVPAQQPVYEDGVVRWFAVLAVVYGIVGMLVGVIVASQLAWPELINGIPWLWHCLALFTGHILHNYVLMCVQICQQLI